uniref:ATPase AAA-type core domain-containing protein n=1 Tax=Rhizophora mucronata TaxID=61149 RepID=A0A2P2LEY6_RHIMU
MYTDYIFEFVAQVTYQHYCVNNAAKSACDICNMVPLLSNPGILVYVLAVIVVMVSVQVNKPSVIFIDEIDALATRYGVSC